MKTTTWTQAPADLLGMGGSVARPCTGLELRAVIGVSPAPRVAPVQGTGVPAGSASRLRPAFLQTAFLQTVAPQTVVLARIGARNAAFTHNSIDGTTLGSHPSGRPLS
jgi:hypothetical protein